MARSLAVADDGTARVQHHEVEVTAADLLQVADQPEIIRPAAVLQQNAYVEVAR